MDNQIPVNEQTSDSSAEQDTPSRKPVFNEYEDLEAGLLEAMEDVVRVHEQRKALKAEGWTEEQIAEYEKTHGFRDFIKELNEEYHSVRHTSYRCSLC